ncbi:MAG: PASTA domain-containing protein [Desulfocapsa sp.]|nr:PASTA domain-containing protein [Desulfocapsa sp.]
MARRSRLKTKNNKRRRIWILLIILGLAGTVAGIGLAYKEQLTNLADIWRETFPSDLHPANTVRGTIYDRNFKELAQTLERVSLYVRPREVKSIPETAEILSGILGFPEPEITARLGRDSHLVWLRRDIAQEDEERITALNLPGIYFHREFARTYPQQELASHLIGYSENDLGLTGVEHYYNRLLNQDRVWQEDIPGIDLKGLKQTSTNGHDLVLTIDMKIQAILEQYVSTLGREMEQGRISSLLLDTVEGEIVAGANYPSYNPNSVWQHENEILDPIFFSPMVVPEGFRRFFRDASLLQGGWELGTQVYPWSLVSPEIDFSRQLRLWERLQLTTDIQVDFSGGKKQGSTLPQFVSCSNSVDFGAVPKTATPLKVLLGMSHLLNGGKKIQPHILDRIIERSEQKEYYYDIFHGELRGRNVLPSLVSNELRILLRAQGTPEILGSTVLSGETVSLVAGKYVRDRMSLTAIPAEKPEMILFLVSREHGLGPQQLDRKGADFLGENIATIIPSMVALQQVGRNLADMAEVAETKERNFKGEQKKESGSSAILSGILNEHTRIMPDLTGGSLRKGLRLLQQAEVTVEIIGSGRIVSQSPMAGKELTKGEHVVLTLKSDAAPPEKLQMKDLQEEGAFE